MYSSKTWTGWWELRSKPAPKSRSKLALQTVKHEGFDFWTPVLTRKKGKINEYLPLEETLRYSCNQNSSPKILNTPYNVSMLNGDLTRRVDLKTEKWMSWTKHIGAQKSKVLPSMQNMVRSLHLIKFWNWNMKEAVKHRYFLLSSNFSAVHSAQPGNMETRCYEIKGFLEAHISYSHLHNLATCVPIDISTQKIM